MKKRVSKFLLSQAAMSGDEHSEDEGEDENQYDLKDSFVDSKEYSENGLNY